MVTAANEEEMCRWMKLWRDAMTKEDGTAIARSCMTTIMSLEDAHGPPCLLVCRVVWKLGSTAWSVAPALFRMTCDLLCTCFQRCPARTRHWVIERGTCGSVQGIVRGLLAAILCAHPDPEQAQAASLLLFEMCFAESGNSVQQAVMGIVGKPGLVTLSHNRHNNHHHAWASFCDDVPKPKPKPVSTDDCLSMGPHVTSPMCVRCMLWPCKCALTVRRAKGTHTRTAQGCGRKVVAIDTTQWLAIVQRPENRQPPTGPHLHNTFAVEEMAQVEARDKWDSTLEPSIQAEPR